MNSTGWLRRLIEEKRLLTLLLLLLCGALLIALSYQTTEKTKSISEDLTYTGGSAEERLARVLSLIDGAGSVDVLVMEEEDGIAGVLIVADGAENLQVRTELMRAAMTALDVSADSVEVFAKKKEETDPS